MLKSIINNTLVVALLAGSQAVMINTATAAAPTNPAQAWMASLAAKLPGAQVVTASGVYVLGYVSQPGATLTVGTSWNTGGTGPGSTGTFNGTFPVEDPGF